MFLDWIVLDHLVGERLRRLVAHRQQANAVGVASGQRDRGAKRSRHQQSADERASVQTLNSPKGADSGSGKDSGCLRFIPQTSPNPQVPGTKTKVLIEHA